MAHSQETKDEAIRLRVEDKLALWEIAEKLGISKGTASIWLQDYPLPKEEVKRRKMIGGRKRKGSTHSEETKQFLSNQRKDWWDNNPEMKEVFRERSSKFRHTPEMKKYFSKKAFEREENGVRSHGTYYQMKCGNSVYLHSSYEVETAKSLDENNIDWTVPKFLRWVDDTGKKRRYFPDFYLPQYDVYLDPKNDYLIQKDARKIELVQLQNQVIVLVLDWQHLTWDKIKEMIE